MEIATSLGLVAFEFLYVFLEIDMQRGECSPQDFDIFGPQRLHSIVHTAYRLKRWQVSPPVCMFRGYIIPTFANLFAFSLSALHLETYRVFCKAQGRVRSSNLSQILARTLRPPARFLPLLLAYSSNNISLLFIKICHRPQ